MTRPVGRIEVWEPGGGAALYTINDAVGIYFKEILTDGVGNFNFTCYSHKDFSGTYTYPNIDLGDTVKIWLDYDAIAGDPNFIGKVTKRSGPLLTETGWVRKIAGLSQGEILLRRQKKNKFYDAVAAATIVTEWADDLSLGTGDIGAEATTVNLEVQTKSYFDLLRWISDYYDAGGSLKKDFWVDLDGDLVWKDRPLRTVGVETLTTADFLSDPLVERELEPVKNDITVYGAAEKPVPSDKDYCESLTDWVEEDGTIDLYGPNGQKVGDYTIRGYTGAGASLCKFKRTLDRLTVRNLRTVYFWHYTAANINDAEVRLHCPDSSNRFKVDLATPNNDWTFNEISLGESNTYYSDSNPNGEWTKTLSPNWWDIKAVEFYFDYSVNDRYSHVDGLYFYPERWSGNANNYTTYRSEWEVTDNKLHSDSECATRAETLLYQYETAPTQITVTVQGNDNVLVGDRLTMTIPSEGISAQPYDVIAVENRLNLDNWTTTPIMVNSANWRGTFQFRRQFEMRKRIRELSMDEKGVK
jgi:hypothetical protein